MTDHQHGNSKTSNIDIKMDGVHKPKKNRGNRKTEPRFTNFDKKPIE